MFSSDSQIKSVQVEAVKILKDGTRVSLGVVSYWHRNPLKRLFFKLFKKGL